MLLLSARTPLRVLVACECSGRVRDAQRRLGHIAWSCDFKASETPGNHYQGDVRDMLAERWDLVIAHPPCTYLSGSGLHWNKRRPERAALTEEALKFVMLFMSYRVPRLAIENPVGCISTQICKPTQIIQPYQFGENASKKTCLWLYGLLKLQPTSYVQPRIVASGPYAGKSRWANQTDSGQNKETPSEHRQADRSRTYQGIANRMAEQWGRV